MAEIVATNSCAEGAKGKLKIIANMSGSIALSFYRRVYSDNKKYQRGPARPKKPTSSHAWDPSIAEYVVQALQLENA